MILHLLLQLVVVALTMWLGAKLLKGVTLDSLWAGLGIAIVLSLVSLILGDLHKYVVEHFPPYTWTLVYILWDTVWLLILSKFVSSVQFRKWYWAVFLASISAVSQTLFWWVVPLPF